MALFMFNKETNKELTQTFSASSLTKSPNPAAMSSQK